MKPSTLRYINLSHDVWALLWRIMPGACKQVMKSRPNKFTNKLHVQFAKEHEINININTN